MTNEVQLLAQYLVEQGLISQWVGPDNISQPAPKLQTRWLDESKIPDSERCLFIRNTSAGGGDRFVSSPVVTIAFMSKTTGDAPVYCETYMQLVYDTLLGFDCADGIVELIPAGRIGGPYQMESGRFVYDCEFIATVESGLIIGPGKIT